MKNQDSLIRNSRTRRPINSPLPLRWASMLLLGIMVSGCSGGSGGSSSAANPSQAAGSWNFFRQGTNCDLESEFASFPLTINSLGGTAFEVLIGYPGEAFAFDGVMSAGVMEVSGTDTVDGTTIEITSSSWQLGPQGDLFLGNMDVIRTENGVPCVVNDFVSVYRVDATNQSPMVGSWEWFGTTTASNGPCNAVGQVEVLDVELLPRNDNTFTLDIFTGDGGEVVLEAEATGNVLEVRGITTSNNDLVTVQPGSVLVLDEVNQEMSGSLIIELDDGVGSPCEFTLLISGIRGGLGTSWLPFVANTLGQELLMGVDPLDPQSTVVMAGPLGLDLTTSTQVGSRLGVAYASELDTDTALRTEGRAETLYFYQGGTVFSIDLEQRANHLGQLLTPRPEFVLSGLGTIHGLRVMEHSEGLEAVLLVFSNIGTQLIEVANDGEVQWGAIDGYPVESTYNASTGEYVGVVTTLNGDLFLERADSQKLIDVEVASPVLLAADGSFYYSKKWPFNGFPTAIYRYEPSTEDVIHIDSGEYLHLSYVDGNDAYFYDVIDTGATYEVWGYRYESDAGAVQLLTYSNDSHYGPFAQSGLQLATLVTESRIVGQVKTSATERRVWSMDREGLDYRDLPDVGLDLRHHVVGQMVDQLFVQGLPGHDHAVIMAADGTEMATLIDASWLLDMKGLGGVHAATSDIGRRSEPIAFLMELAGSLYAYDFSSPTSNPRLLGAGLTGFEQRSVVQHGDDLLFAAGHDIHFAKTFEPNSAVRVTDTPLEEDVPVQ